MAAKKLTRKAYERELAKLQIELVQLQEWVKYTGTRIVIVFEGRDTAGKSGVIHRIEERVSPRVFRTVALPAPTERERSQLYMQRYLAHFPAAGEIILFDRSWYNRAGVERVMGFCTQEECEDFLRMCPHMEREIIHSGIILIKYFFDVGEKEQKRRFLARLNDPLRQWKLSDMDIESYQRWWDYTQAYNDMFAATDTDFAPWHIVPADDKRRARLNCLAHLLSVIPYQTIPKEKSELPKRQARPKGAKKELSYQNTVPQRF